MCNDLISRTRISTSWLFTPPLHRKSAFGVSLAAIAFPLAISLALTSGIKDQPCTIFCPFILATLILCGWRYAIAVTAGGVISCNTVLMGTPYTIHPGWSELEWLSVFVGYSVFLIVVIELFRITARRSLRQAGAKERMSGIVFSLEGGQAWASWYGIDAPVRLGARDEVVEMMKDFIAQVELGRRLEARREKEVPLHQAPIG